MITATNINLILSICTFLGILFAIYKYFRDPDEKANKEIALMKQACGLKHEGINKDISEIKNNHLAHIERDIASLKETQVKILTILEERNIK